MIFTRMAQVVAMLALLFGAMFVFAEVFYANPNVISDPAYPGPRPPKGWYVERGAYAIFLGLALGTLTEISLSVRKGNT